MWSTEKSGAFSKKRAATLELEIFHLESEFWDSIFAPTRFSDSWLDAKLNFTRFQNFFCPNPSYEQKVVPVLRKGLRIRVFGVQKQGRRCRRG
jgi:hypothetical protein